VNPTTAVQSSASPGPRAHGTTLPTLQSLSPIDIAQQRFPLAWRGYRAADVQQFLAMVAEQVAQLQAACHLLEARLRLSEAAGQTLNQREAAFDTAVLQARNAAAQKSQEAQQAAAATLQQANTQAQAIIDAATAQSVRLAADNASLLSQRQSLLGELRGVLCTHSRLLEVQEDETPALAEPLQPRAVLDQLRVPPPPGAQEIPAGRTAQPTTSPARHSQEDCRAPA
jgi:cell division initiation protein